MSFCRNIRKGTNDYFEVSFHHSFVKGLENGKLPNWESEVWKHGLIKYSQK